MTRSIEKLRPHGQKKSAKFLAAQGDKLPAVEAALKKARAAIADLRDLACENSGPVETAAVEAVIDLATETCREIEHFCFDFLCMDSRSQHWRVSPQIGDFAADGLFTKLDRKKYADLNEEKRKQHEANLDGYRAALRDAVCRVAAKKQFFPALFTRLPAQLSRELSAARPGWRADRLRAELRLLPNAIATPETMPPPADAELLAPLQFTPLGLEHLVPEVEEQLAKVSAQADSG